MKHIISILISLCTLNAHAFDLSALGNLDVMRDIGFGDAQRVIQTYNKTMVVLGYPTNLGNAPSNINRGYGQIKQMQQYNGLNIESIPGVIVDAQEVGRYLNIQYEIE